MIAPSLETRWLKLDKGLPQPLVVFAEDPTCGGCYYEPWGGETYIAEHFYDTRKGILVISDLHYPERHAETIAHEYRHHWQRFNSRQYYGYPSNYRARGDDYRAATIEYFTSSVCELDALLFSLSKSPNNLTLQWYEWVLPFIVPKYSCLRPRPLVQ